MRATINLDDALLPTQPAPPPYPTPTFSMGLVRDGINLVKSNQLAGDLEDDEIIKKLARGV